MFSNICVGTEELLFKTLSQAADPADPAADPAADPTKQQNYSNFEQVQFQTKRTMSVHENDCFRRMENIVLHLSYPNPSHSHRNPSLVFFEEKLSQTTK